MLETVSEYLEYVKSSNTPFYSYYNDYVMKIQDSNIDKELSYMLNYGISSLYLIDRAIVDACKELPT